MLFKINNTGSRRTVFIFKNKVIKIPKLNRWVNFISGIMENLEERYWWCSGGGYGWNDSYPLAKIFWADRFGLIVIQEKLCVPTDESKFLFDLAHSDLITFRAGKFATDDVKMENFGYDSGGRLLKLDYGYFHGTMSCYLGAKATEKKQFCGNRRK